MSDWISFVKKFARENGIPYNEALQRAAPFYHDKNKGMGVAAGIRKNRSNSMTSTSKSKKNFNMMAEDLLGYGGEQAQKGALAALLSGLNAQIKID